MYQSSPKKNSPPPKKPMICFGSLSIGRKFLSSSKKEFVQGGESIWRNRKAHYLLHPVFPLILIPKSNFTIDNYGSIPD